jgi:hypothetical protein
MWSSVRSAGRGARRAVAAVGARGGRTARRAAVAAGRDARSVAGTATAAATRRLQPRPRGLIEAERPQAVAPAADPAPVSATATTAELPADSAAAADGAGRVALRTAPRGPDGGRRRVQGPAPGGPGRGPLPPLVAPGGNGHHGLGYDEEPEPPEETGLDLAGSDIDSEEDAAVAVPTQVRVGQRAQRHGVIVPLRVPFRTRLKATVGLCALVVFLGTATALIVVGLALAGAQALSGL